MWNLQNYSYSGSDQFEMTPKTKAEGPIYEWNVPVYQLYEGSDVTLVDKSLA